MKVQQLLNGGVSVEELEIVLELLAFFIRAADIPCYKLGQIPAILTF
jgi:hypothetical protein